MNYLSIYNKIIENALNQSRKKSGDLVYELHHIIPRSLGGEDTNSNTVLLTLREHFLAHILLCKIHKNDYTAASKMFSAVRRMLGSKKYIIKSSYIYERARLGFIINHPCKTDSTKDKIRESLRDYRLSSGWKIIYCACGCNNEIGVSINEKTKYLKDHHPTKLCRCGCNLPVDNRKTNYVKGHDLKKYKCACGCDEDTHKSFDIENEERVIYKRGHRKENDNLVNSINSYLSKLSTEQMKARMNNSTKKCNHDARVKAIKKGKSSEFLLIKRNGDQITFFSYDDVLKLTGYDYNQIKYRIKRYGGLLESGDVVTLVRKYEGNDKNIGRKRNNSL